jgi:hypothetical protein
MSRSFFAGAILQLAEIVNVLKCRTRFDNAFAKIVCSFPKRKTHRLPGSSGASGRLSEGMLSRLTRVYFQTADRHGNHSFFPFLTAKSFRVSF